MPRPLSNEQRSISLLPEPPVLRQSVLFARGSTRSVPFARGSTNISMRRTCKRLTCTYHGTPKSPRFATPYLEHLASLHEQVNKVIGCAIWVWFLLWKKFNRGFRGNEIREKATGNLEKSEFLEVTFENQSLSLLNQQKRTSVVFCQRYFSIKFQEFVRNKNLFNSEIWNF